MADFTSSRGLTVTPPSGDGGAYTIVGPNTEGDPTTFTLDALRDECSCGAIQGIACDHKDAVDEYTSAATVEELGHEPGHEHKEEEPTEHRPKYERELAGMTETTPRRPFYAYTIRCSCGWVFTVEPESKESGVTKKMAQEIWRGHAQKPAPAEEQAPDQLYDNREDFLHAAKLLWWERFALFGVEYPSEVRVGVGFTSSRKKGIRGECWRKEASRDRTYEIIMSNREDDPAQILRTLGHELVHTAAPPDSGHGKEFSQRAKAVGFKRAFSDSSNTTEELETWIKEALDKLGRYPHAALEPTVRREGGPKKQTNRWLKYHCSVEGCGWIIRSPKAGFVGACLSPMHFNPETGEGAPGIMLPGFETEEEPPSIAEIF